VQREWGCNTAGLLTAVTTAQLNEWVQALYCVLLVSLQSQISFFRHAVITGRISVNETQRPLHFRFWAKHSNQFCVIRDVWEHENFVKDYPLYFWWGRRLNMKHQHGGLAIFLYVYKSVSHP
jgi:hypothetical protein